MVQNELTYFSFVRKLIALILLMVIVSCEQDQEVIELVQKVNIASEEISIPLLNDTTIQLDYLGNEVMVDIIYPADTAIGTLLILQGWNFPRTDWCDSTSLCEKALLEGFVLVCPDMGKSIYHMRTYPETRKDWLSYPTKTWVDSAMIPAIQSNFNLFLPEFKNVVLGLSTGARGAFILALDSPDIFDGAACLSGDYDMILKPLDNLYRGYFGDFEKNTERWGGDENPASRLGNLQTHVYLSHGAEDNIVAPSHSLVLYEWIQQKSDSNLVDLNIQKGYGHNYTFWNSEVDNIMKFFSGI